MSHSWSRTLPCAWLRDARVATVLMRHGTAACAAWIGLFAAPAAAGDDPWLDIQVIRHADFQAVNPDGTPAYARDRRRLAPWLTRLRYPCRFGR